VTSGGASRSPLGRVATARPEEPLLFFRDLRGHFAWWSWARAAAVAAGGAFDPESEASAARFSHELERSAELPEAVAAAALLASRLGVGRGREIWIANAQATLEGPGAVYAALAVDAGWAIVLDPAAEPSPATTLWARPTLLTGSGAALAGLLEGIAAEAPRRRRETWLRRRLERLRAVIVDDDRCGDLEPRLLALGSAARVLPFREGGW